MLTVLTICKNDHDNLLKTFASLASFRDDLSAFVSEIIVKDAGSIDGTDSLVEDYVNKFNRLNVKVTYVKEPDTGIFNAMNVCVDLCKSDALMWFLNAGDEVSNELKVSTLIEALSNFKTSDETVCFFRSKNVFFGNAYYMPTKKIIDNKAFAKWVKYNTPVHQAVVFKRSSHIAHYNEKLNVSSDSVTIYLNLISSNNLMYFPLTICSFYLGGNSGVYVPYMVLRERLNEQKLIANLRNEPLWSQILRVTTFYAKFAIQSLRPDSYHQIQSRLRQLMQKCT